jgi:hypothetical protein
MAVVVAAAKASSNSNSYRAQPDPVEILSKPTPAYSPEAQELHLEGDVLLQVVFLSKR